MSDFELFITANLGWAILIAVSVCLIGFALMVISREEAKRLGEGIYKAKGANTWSKARTGGWVLFVVFGLILMVLAYYTLLTFLG